MKTHHISKPALALAGLMLVALVGCGGSDDTATLNLAVSDTPVDGATHVMVTFTGVQVKGSTGAAQEFDFSSPKHIDLLAQQGGNSAMLLDGVKIAAGSYEWIRLKVDPTQTTITLTDGSVHPLTIPSGDQTGLKLVSGFTAAAGGTMDFTIDFNLRQSVTLAAGTYILKPALRLVDNLQTGQIMGTVDANLVLGGVPIASPACSPAAYVYTGGGVSPVDINTTSAVQPIETASLVLNTTTGSFDYTAAFLAAGTYTVALVCAAGDSPLTVDSLAFSAPKDATVTAGAVTTVDFP